MRQYQLRINGTMAEPRLTAKELVWWVIRTAQLGGEAYCDKPTTQIANEYVASLDRHRLVMPCIPNQKAAR